MIIRLVKCSHEAWLRGKTKDLLREHEGEWLKCIKPYGKLHVEVCIEGTTIRIPNRFISQAINDDRYMYEYCSYCGTVQERDLPDCAGCGRSKNYLCALKVDPGENKGCEQILKESMGKVFAM